ncbi:MAG TPA: ElyC/SanA/YdcF family protein [Verrucomicrobiae bacterium]|nr:ElyC/SanA/YdcF family protein [Verrucomicrobiae bacterium]
MRRLFRSLLAFFAIPVLIFLVIWGSERFVSFQTQPHLYTEMTAIPQEEVAVVFGAGLKRPGEVGGVLQGRLDTAYDLYSSGKVKKIVLSGDNISEDYDEVTPMVTYLKKREVPASVLIEDRKGISTYDTCYRLKNTSNITQAILVTNEFHLPRAVFTCRKLGIDAKGMATPNYPGFEYSQSQREPLATVKMLIDLYIAPPQPLQ